MRITSYNILNGGVGRADPVAEVLEAQQADVIVLVEADDTWVMHRIAKRLGMDAIHAPGHGHGVAILSRWPIVQTVNHALRWDDGPRSMVEAVIRMPTGMELPIVGLHLHPRADEADEDRRLTDIAHVLNVAAPWRRENRPHVLAGDFNSNAPTQRIDPAKCKPSTQKSFEKNGGQIPRRVVHQLLTAGYTDTLHAFAPKIADHQATFTTHEPGQRVDYIFTHGVTHKQLKGAWIEHDRLATYASDHYPVGAEIDV